MAYNERSKQANYNWRKNNPEKWAKVLNKAQKKRLGITQEELDDLIEAIEGKCMICGEKPPELTRSGKPKRSLLIDHDHTCCEPGTKRCGECNRGLICTRCNTMIGQMETRPDLVDKINAYLENPPMQTALEALYS